jgi:hypothetical protein
VRAMPKPLVRKKDVPCAIGLLIFNEITLKNINCLLSLRVKMHRDKSVWFQLPQDHGGS